MIKLVVNGQQIDFTTTVFPDGTSQVWKVDTHLTDADDIKVEWLFESEAEVMQLCQLAQLTQQMSEQDHTEVYAPYLPYARQDKEISNKMSFSKNTFLKIMGTFNISLRTYDAHSDMPDIKSVSPRRFHQAVSADHGIICFPDKGATVRYAVNFPNYPTIFFEKQRNFVTGEITSLKVVANFGYEDLHDKKILIVDDICDGGMTFIKVAEELRKHKANNIDLAVSHGLFSKGKQVLHDAGITNIFTTNSLLRNPEGFKVW